MIKHSISINAPKDSIFQLYQDVAAWPAWDNEVSDVSLEAFSLGASGWLKPRKGPKAKIKITELEPGHSFTVESALPLCRIRFGHDLIESRNKTTATHWVQFVGPLAFLFRRLIGNELDQTLPQTLLGLKQASEETRVSS